MAHVGRLRSLLKVARDEGWSTWIRSSADEKAVLGGCWFDQDAANRVVTFFERFLRHTKGQWAGQPFTLLDWQKNDVLMPLFGWKRRSGFRRFRNAYVEIPKKNGKSELCAGLSLYLLVADDEPGAEVYAAAADHDQASIVYGESERMVAGSPPLRKRLTIIRSRKTIVHRKTNSVYRALSADVPTKEGLNIHGLIFDELHAQKSRSLYDTLRYGGAARRQPLLVSITTAGFDRQSICWEQHEYALQILKGIIDDEAFFAFIRAANEDPNEGPVDDWTDPRTWRKANPSMGVTIDEEAFAAECREAQNKPSLQNAFKRYRLNIWTSAETRWLDLARWDACKGEVGLEALKGCAFFAGLDLANIRDVAAAVFLFPMEDGRFFVTQRFWVPKENMEERVKKDRVPYDAWVRDGWMAATPGDVIDYAWIEKEILDFAERHQPQEIAFDPWNATQITTNLQEKDLTVVPVRQGFASMSPPMKQLEALIFQGRIVHDGNPVMRWMVDNVTATMDPAGNIKPDKGKSREKIDGVVALIMAVSRALFGEEEGPSVYEEREPVVI